MENLSQIEEFRLSPELIAKLHQHSIIRKYAPGSVILNENAHIRSIPIVTEGSLRVIRTEEDGRERLEYIFRLYHKRFEELLEVIN